MKIDKLNLKHWTCLITSAITVAAACLIRFTVKPDVNIVVFYGHKLNGNLKPIFEKLPRNNEGKIKITPIYATLDKDYYKVLKSNNINAIYLCNIKSALLLSQAKVLISDHGLHTLIILKKITNVKFVDVWHGIPFKGFDSDDLKTQHDYDEIWVASRFLKNIYVEKFGFKENIVHATGYARTDILIKNNNDLLKLKEKYGIHNTAKKVILFCPTWAQDISNRSIFPFENQTDDFILKLDRFCAENSAVCILRTHLNTNFKQTTVFKNVVFFPSSEYPQTEEILLISDIMICDWSSVAFDYLLLKRPTIFIDIAPPFKKGLSISSTFRYGKIVSTIEEMYDSIATYLIDPQKYKDDFLEKSLDTISHIYGNSHDGMATERCKSRLINMLSSLH